MGERQHSAPVLLHSNAQPASILKPLDIHGGVGSISEATLRDLIHNHPQCLPIAEIDPIFKDAVAICTEMPTPAGNVDNLLITANGLPVLVECKLWRNPEARREVVGQILDYAKELSRWSSADLQREVSKRLKRSGNVLLEAVRTLDPNVGETEFNDNLTANLRRGRFLLLIAGDGIREGVEAIAEYVQQHANLRFSLGLVELPIYLLPNGDRLVAPRVLARVNVTIRNIIELPTGLGFDDEDGEDQAPSVADGVQNDRFIFWSEFLKLLKLDDPEQQIPKAGHNGYLWFVLPSPGISAWLVAYRSVARGEVGITFNSLRDGVGDYVRRSIVDDWDMVKAQIGGDARVIQENGRSLIREVRQFGDLNEATTRLKACQWLAERLNVFVNAMRPLVRSAVADFQRQQL